MYAVIFLIELVNLREFYAPALLHFDVLLVQFLILLTNVEFKRKKNWER